MRISSLVVAVAASLLFTGVASAEYEGLSKFHWKRFVDKREKETAMLIAADLAKAGEQYRKEAALAEARLAYYQNLLASVEAIDTDRHAEVVQLSAVTVTVTSGQTGGRALDELERETYAVASAAPDSDDMTTGSVPRNDDEPGTTGIVHIGPFRLVGRPATPATHW